MLMVQGPVNKEWLSFFGQPVKWTLDIADKRERRTNYEEILLHGFKKIIVKFF